MTPRPPGYREPTEAEMQCLPEGALTECIDGEWRISNKIGQSVDVKGAKYFAIPTDKETVPYVHEVAAEYTHPPTAAPIPGYVADRSAAATPLDPLASQVGGSHYKDYTIQPVEFIHANKLPFLEGCVIKRVCRHAAKNGAEDIRKAIHELQLILKLQYGAEP